MPLIDFANRNEAAEQKEYRYFQQAFILRPENWRAYKNPAPLVWKGVRATAQAAKSIPNDKTGVYSFVVDPETAAHPGTRYLLYVGKVEEQSLRTRFRQYLRDAKDPKGRVYIVDMFQKWPEHLWFYFAEVNDANKIHQLELDLIGTFLPPECKQFPAEIRRPVDAAWRR